MGYLVHRRILYCSLLLGTDNIIQWKAAYSSAVVQQTCSPLTPESPHCQVPSCITPQTYKYELPYYNRSAARSKALEYSEIIIRHSRRNPARRPMITHPL
jgi:hypothetical protein